MWAGRGGWCGRIRVRGMRDGVGGYHVGDGWVRTCACVAGLLGGWVGGCACSCGWVALLHWCFIEFSSTKLTRLICSSPLISNRNVISL